MKLPEKIDLRTAIILFILAIVLTISGASILFEKVSIEKTTGLASASIGLSLQKPSAEPEEPEEEDDSGGGGGAGGGGGPSDAKIISYEKYLPAFSEGSYKSIIVPDEVYTHIRMVSIDNTEMQKNLTFRTRNYLTKPFRLDAAPGFVYGYCNLEIENLNESLVGDIWVHFRVSRSWFSKNRIGENTITLHRYSDAWQTFETEQVRSTPEYFYYKALTPGFSTFAISGTESKTGMHLVYDSNITIYVGGKATHTVVVENIGEMFLSDVTVSAEHQSFNFNVSPSSIPELIVGSKGTYVMTIEVPDKIVPGTYDVLLRANSKESFKEATFQLIVPAVPKPAVAALLSNQIDNLKSTATKIWVEAQWIGLRGGNVSLVFNLIDIAKNSLDQATQTFGMIDFADTTKFVEEARTNLEKAVIKLAEQQPYLKFFSLSPMTVIVILVFLLVAGFGGYKLVGRYEHAAKAYSGKQIKLVKKEVIIKETKKTKLVKQLSLAESAYQQGHISKKIYNAEKARIKKEMKK